MKATKRDYERFVLVIRALEKDDEKRFHWAQEIANILEESNPLFDRAKFIESVCE